MTWRVDTDTVSTDDQPTEHSDGEHTATRRNTAELRVMTALAEIRKARHHKDCYCRMFDGNWCNAAEALWSRALERELGHITPLEQD